MLGASSVVTGKCAGVTGSEYWRAGETGKPKAWGARGEAAATVVARISKGETGVADVQDGGGVEGGKGVDTGGGVLPMETGVRISVQMSGDEVVVNAEASSPVLGEESSDKY